ncbi:hypothetical protein ACHAPJ_013603 [Fusarium lateritium]
MATSLWSKQEDVDAFWRASVCDNPSGDSILHLAVLKDDLELAERLLDAGFPVNIHNNDERTPLHSAAELELLEITQLLIAQGASVFPQTNHSRKQGTKEGQNVDKVSASTDTDDVPAPPAKKNVETSQDRNVPSPLEIALDKDKEGLAPLFIKHALSTDVDASQEYTLLRFMARAFVAKRKDVLQAFLQAGWNIDRRHSAYRRPFLHYVCEEAEDVDPVKRLKEAGADVTRLDIASSTALHLAAQSGKCHDGSVVKYLIDDGASVTSKERYWGATPLIAAVQHKRIANARVLLGAGSDANAIVQRDDINRTVLHLAAQDGTPEMIQLLLEWGANPNALDELGGTPARWAIRNNHIEAVRILFEWKLDPNFDKGHSLQLAIQLRRLEIIELFVQHGATLKRGMIHLARGPNKDNAMPLLELCVQNLAPSDKASSDEDAADKEPKVKLRISSFDIPNTMRSDTFDDYRLCALLVEYEHGENLTNLKDVPRAVLICICIEHGLTKAVAQLLKLGNINKTIRGYRVRPFGWTALHLAAYKGNTPLVNDLFSNGWDLAEEDNLGRTALDLAAYQGSVELVESLLAMNCNAEHRDRDGQTPLHYAVSSQGRKDIRLLECLVEAGCDVSKASSSGETALHRAARFNTDDAAAWLLKKGSKVSSKDGSFNTPLHVAASFDSIAVVRTLLSYGAQLSPVAIDGRTPLHCACQLGANDAVVALLDTSADPNKADGLGHTALATAIYWGRCKLSTIDVLLECTKIDWTAPRTSHLVVIAALAVKSPGRASVLGRVIQVLRTTMGEKKASRVIKRLMPEMVPEILVSADDLDRGSPADVIPLLLDFLPENDETRHLVLFEMLIAIIKHGGDDDGQLTRRLLQLDDSNVGQELPGRWGFSGLCCRSVARRDLADVAAHSVACIYATRMSFHISAERTMRASTTLALPSQQRNSNAESEICQK